MRSCCELLFAGRAGVHIDFHADRHFDDLRRLPGHFRSPCSGTVFALGSKLLRLKNFASDLFACCIAKINRLSDRRVEKTLQDQRLGKRKVEPRVKRLDKLTG
jgi:hypothetical protein